MSPSGGINNEQVGSADHWGHDDHERLGSSCTKLETKLNYLEPKNYMISYLFLLSQAFSRMCSGKKLGENPTELRFPGMELNRPKTTFSNKPGSASPVVEEDAAVRSVGVGV